ncbi:hypothetical protein HLB42_16495 [Deinococcus sp. D7000]|nr:hypothetical protein HLB42_16495 [Deinococcus sp. D7000]
MRALNADDALLLRTPLRPWQIWLAPWLVQTGPALLGGAGFGVLLWLWWPTWWAAALGLPPLLLGGQLARLLWYDARTVGDHVTQHRPMLLFLVPLLGALHPALLPLGLLGGVLGLGWLWRRFWHADVPAQVVLHAQVEALRRGAVRLGLPALDMGADGTRPARRWTLALRGSGVFPGVGVAQQPAPAAPPGPATAGPAGRAAGGDVVRPPLVLSSIRCSCERCPACSAPRWPCCW